MNNENTAQAAWPQDRREELETLRTLLIDVSSINSGSHCLERIARCIESAKQLQASEFGSRRPSFIAWLIAEATETAAATAAQPGIPAGFALVPLEPTPEMLTAAETASMQHLIDCINDPALSDKLGSEEMCRLTHGSRYRAMVAAAPAAGTTEA